jgi:Zn-dependent protease
VCCFFACITLHELGHSWVAQGFGLSVREIVLLPIGGVARLGREPQRPIHELLIALAGPLVNVAIAAVLIVLALLTFGRSWLLEGGVFEALVHPSWGGLLAGLLLGNISLAVFNMIPALPMDGGRVFRALLAMVLGKPRATNIAAFLGQVLAAGLVVLAIRQDPVDPMLAVIGMFVFLGAAQERASNQAGELLATIRAADVVSHNTIVLGPGDVLGSVVGHILRTPQSHFPVVHGEQLLGVLAREDALRSLGELGPDAYVAGLIQRGVPEVDASMPLDQVRSRILENEGRPVVVRTHHGYLGLLSFEDVSRAARVATRLEKSKLRRTSNRSRSGAPLV